MSTFTLKAGDRNPHLDYVLGDNGVPVDLTGSTIAVRFRPSGGGTVTTLTPTVLSAVAGSLRITWPTGLPTSVAGSYFMDTIVTWGDGTTETWPNGSSPGHVHDLLVVTEALT